MVTVLVLVLTVISVLVVAVVVGSVVCGCCGRLGRGGRLGGLGDGVVGGAITGAEVVVVGVVVVVVSGDESPEASLINAYTARARITAASAPSATSAAGLRYHGTSGSGGCWYPPSP